MIIIEGGQREGEAWFLFNLKGEMRMPFGNGGGIRGGAVSSSRLARTFSFFQAVGAIKSKFRLSSH